MHLTEEATAVLSEAMTGKMSCEPLTYHGREALKCEFRENREKYSENLLDYIRPTSAEDLTEITFSWQN